MRVHLLCDVVVSVAIRVLVAESLARGVVVSVAIRVLVWCTCDRTPSVLSLLCPPTLSPFSDTDGSVVLCIYISDLPPCLTFSLGKFDCPVSVIRCTIGAT